MIQLNEEQGRFEAKGSFDHPYPCTKIIWAPDKVGTADDVLATTGDYLRLWSVGEDNIKLQCLLNNVGRVIYSLVASIVSLTLVVEQKQ